MINQPVQVLFIHGGMTFKSRHDYLNFLRQREIVLENWSSWSREYLDQALGDNFEVIRPAMPLKENACYDDWLIHFERYLPLLRDNIVLIGSSLGGLFLAKYLSEQKFPKKILSTYLVCPPFDDTLFGENLAGGFELGSDLSLLEQNCSNLRLLFARQDDVVPIDHAAKYRQQLKQAEIIIYDHIAGHFKITEFPEIIVLIKNDLQKYAN